MDVNKALHEAETLSKRLDGSLKELGAALASAIAEENNHSVVPQDVQKKRLELELDSIFTTFKRRVENGIHHIINTVVELSKTNKDFVKSELAIDLKKFVDFFYHLKKERKTIDEYLKKLLQENKTLQEVCGVSDQTLEMFYKAAKHLHEQHNFEQAADAFGLLTILNGRKAQFWLGLGNAEYLCSRFEPALLALTFAIALEPQNPIPHIQAARCYEKIQQLDFAMNSLDVALVLMKDKKEFSALQKIVQQHKNVLEHKKAV